MNAQTRKELNEILNEMTDLRERLQEIMDDEQYKFDNLSEGLQASEMGQNLEQAASDLDDVISDLDSAIDNLDMLAN